MVYSGFPHSTADFRYASIPVLDTSLIDSIKPIPADKKGNIHLEMFGDKPIYRVYKSRHRQKIFDAQNLKPIKDFTEEECKVSAKRYHGTEVESVEMLTDFDQWIPWSSYKAHFPIVKCKMKDDGHWNIYVSSKTGEVVQATSRKKRWLARFGAIPHYAYYKFLRLNTSLWAQVVIWASALGSIMCLSGIIVGFIRLRRSKNKPKKWNSPYKKFWWKWHHVLGLVFGIFSFTFVFSGMISVSDIPQWLVSTEMKKSPRREWNKQKHDFTTYTASHKELLSYLKEHPGVKRVSFKNVMGNSYYYLYSEKRQVPEVIDALLKKKALFTEGEIKGYMQNLFPEQSIAISQQLNYDNYYQASGMGFRPCPAYKLTFNNSDKNWLYISPQTGEAVYELNKNTRVRRWLYRAFHTFNLQFFREHEWLRKLLLIIVSLGGLGISISGLVLSMKWMRRKQKSN